jgi:hypothetical protein
MAAGFRIVLGLLILGTLYSTCQQMAVVLLMVQFMILWKLVACTDMITETALM